MQQMAFPSLLHWSQSAEPILMALAGGIHTFFGPVVGAALFVFANFAITRFSDYPLLIFGFIILILVVYLPGGILGAAQEWIKSKRGGS
jgi:branched-chain amino acid transport system permease protein